MTYQIYVEVIARSDSGTDDTKLAALTEGMVVSAYQDVINTIDIDSLIDEFLNQAQVKKALTQVQD